MLENWLPIAELRLIFRHLVVAVALAGTVFVATKVFDALAPAWAQTADMVDGFTIVGILVILSLKLLYAFARTSGIHVFAAT